MTRRQSRRLPDAALAALLALLPAALGALQILNPYLLHFKGLKLVAYSLALLPAVLVDGALHLRLSWVGLLFVAYSIAFGAFFLAARTGRRHPRRLPWWLAAVAAYVSLSVLALW